MLSKSLPSTSEYLSSVQVDLYFNFEHSADQDVISLPPASLMELAAWNVCPEDAPHGVLHYVPPVLLLPCKPRKMVAMLLPALCGPCKVQPWPPTMWNVTVNCLVIGVL
jgi:hypothetical protein